MIDVVLYNFFTDLRGLFVHCDAKDDADDDANLMTWYWSGIWIRSVKNFNLVSNIDHKRKGDGAGIREEGVGGQNR